MRRIVGIVAIALVAATGCAELGLPDGAVGAPGRAGGDRERAGREGAGRPGGAGEGQAGQADRGRPARQRLPADPRLGPAWSVDVDRNGCGTRNDIRSRDLTRSLRGRCTVVAGVLADPYTGHR